MGDLRLAASSGDPVYYLGADLDDLYVSWLDIDYEPRDLTGYQFRLVISATEASPPLVDKTTGIFPVDPGPSGAPADNLRVVWTLGELAPIPVPGTYVVTIVATREDGRRLIGVGYIEFRAHAAA